MWKLIYVNPTRISVGSQLNNMRFMRMYNILLFLSERKLPNTFPVFPSAKFTQRQNIYYYPGNSKCVMADIFMCALKMLIGEKCNAWHKYIKKR